METESARGRHQGPSPTETARRAGQLLREGSPEALQLIHDEISPLLQFWLSARFAGRLDTSERQDVLSTVLVHIWEGRKGYDPRRSLASWAHAITRNIAFDVLRRKLRHSEASEWTAENEPAYEVQEEESTLVAIRQADLEALLKSLDKNEQVVVRDYIANGSEPQWAKRSAEGLGITTNALRVRKHRAITKMRMLWNQQNCQVDANGR